MQAKSLFMSSLVALATLACSVSANAATYLLRLDGVADHTPYCYWEPYFPCNGTTPVHVQSEWTGLMTIVLDTSADGTFGGSDVTSMSLNANGGSFSFPIADYGYFAEISVLDGRVTSMDAGIPLNLPDDNFTVFGIRGLSAEFNDFGTHHYGSTYYAGTLTPIPEPDELALVVAGLLTLVARKVRNRRLHEQPSDTP